MKLWVAHLVRMKDNQWVEVRVSVCISLIVKNITLENGNVSDEGHAIAHDFLLNKLFSDVGIQMLQDPPLNSKPNQNWMIFLFIKLAQL